MPQIDIKVFRKCISETHRVRELSQSLDVDKWNITSPKGQQPTLSQILFVPSCPQTVNT